MSILLLFGLMAIVTPVNANALTFYLDEVNVNNTGEQGPWASVTLTDSKFSGKDSVHFVVEPIESAFTFTSTDTNFGLQTFYFNENTTFGSDLQLGNFASTGWSYNYSSSYAYNAGGDFGKFEFLAGGTGSSRANPLSFDVYAGSGTDITIENFSSVLSPDGYLFAAHIADYNGGKSAKFATDGSVAPVPEPSTILLLGSGLFGLGWFGRKRKKS